MTNGRFPIYEKTHRSGNCSWVVSLGLVSGKRQFRAFPSREQAEHFRAAAIETASKQSESFADLSELARASLRVTLEKLKPYDVTLPEVADFYIKYAKPPGGKITIQEGMDLFEQAKRRKNLSEKYITTAARCFFAPFRDAFRNSLVNDISPAQAEKYLHQNEEWSGTTRNTHNRHLRTFYSFLIKRGHATMNPFTSIEFANEPNTARQKIMTPDAVKTLLQYALDRNRYHRECACMALVFFCGVRVDEVERLDWSQITLEGDEPTVAIEESKEGQRRVNTIPSNAREWLRLCRREGRVAPTDYAQRMKRLRKRANIDYPQNAARHCFASYHIAYHRNAAETSFLLGHPNAALLYNRYRALVSFGHAERFWDILPDAVLNQRDEVARIRAEAESCCGQAYKDASGMWLPIDPLSAILDECDSIAPDDEYVRKAVAEHV